VIYRFADFTLDPAGFRLHRHGDVVPLSPKIFDLLLYLVARPATVVSKDELFDALWPDVAVTDNALTQAVSELRQALGDDAASPAFVQTVARRGYRFIAAVQHGEAAPARSADAAGESRRPHQVQTALPAIAVTWSKASEKVTVRQPPPDRSASQTRPGVFIAQCSRAAVMVWKRVS